jgi:signal transduction histidine kinase
VTIRGRLALVLAVNALLAAALVAVQARTANRSDRLARELSDVSSQLVLSSAQLTTRAQQLDESLAKYAITRDAGYRERAADLRAAIGVELEQLNALELRDDEARALAVVGRAWVDARAASSAVAAQGRTTAAGLDAAQRALEAFTEAVTAFGVQARAGMRARVEAAADAADGAQRLSVLLAALALLLALLSALTLSRAIVEPLRRLIVGTEEVAEGRFDHRLARERGAEFAQVAAAFNGMTERLGALDRMKREFVSNVSHDLKSPLASLRESADVLLDGIAGPLTPQQRRVLTLQRESADRLGRMIAKLLELSRLEADPSLVRVRLDLSRLAHAAARQAEPVAASRGQRLRVLVPGAVQVLGDEDALRSLLDNLVENALKFSPDAGEIEIAVSAEGTMASLQVSDRGPGVPEGERERIFERFQQTAAGRNVTARGVGLGLTICREVARAHGGRIGVHGRPGGGSTFEVALPLAALAEVAA